MGAEAVQIGTRFALTAESSAHEDFKRLCLSLEEGDTLLTLKKLSPTRLVKNALRTEIEEAEERGATKEDLLQLLGAGRARRGMLEGDLEQGELEIGQIAALLKGKPIQTVSEVMAEIVDEYKQTKVRLLG